jgi:hypothetical protein
MKSRTPYNFRSILSSLMICMAAHSAAGAQESRTANELRQYAVHSAEQASPDAQSKSTNAEPEESVESQSQTSADGVRTATNSEVISNIGLNVAEILIGCLILGLIPMCTIFCWAMVWHIGLWRNGGKKPTIG